MDYNIIQGACTLTNSGDNFVGTLPINIPSYVNNGLYLVRAPITNTTTTPTLNLNGLGAVTITTNTGAPLAIGQILDSGWYILMFSSSNRFLLLDNNNDTNFIKGNIVLFNNTTEDSFTTTASYQTFSNKSFTVPANTLVQNGDKLNIRTIIDKKSSSSAPDVYPMIFIDGQPAYDNSIVNATLTMGVSSCLLDVEFTRTSNTTAFVSMTFYLFGTNYSTQGGSSYYFYSRLTSFNFSSTFNISAQAKDTGVFSGTIYCEQLRIERFMV